MACDDEFRLQGVISLLRDSRGVLQDERGCSGRHLKASGWSRERWNRKVRAGEGARRNGKPLRRLPGVPLQEKRA